LDQGRGVDLERVLGSWQPDEFREHEHLQSTEGNRVGKNYTSQLQTGYAVSKNENSYTFPEGGTETRGRNVAYPAYIYAGRPA
jgi:hypothetical protein